MNENKFIYEAVLIDDDHNAINFSYTLLNNNQRYTFNEVLILPCSINRSRSVMSCLRALHIALGISYYKLFVPHVIEHPYKMDVGETEFWNEVFINGLGEFMYINKLPIDRLAKFKPQSGMELAYDDNSVVFDKGALLGIGGGKDSIVARELLRDINIKTSGFVLASQDVVGVSGKVAKLMDIELLVIKRYIDTKLIELQQQDGAYNGHIPVSLIFALCGSLLAANYGFNYVILADESSSSIPRVTWNKRLINHQWSKSFEFEVMFKEYIKLNVNEAIEYFSIIRQLSSVAVAKLFANYPLYFQDFTSDNFVFRINPANRPKNRWSLESPKSLSSFILLAPWLSVDDLVHSFGSNLFNEDYLEPMFLSLFAINSTQPLDCVGTVTELKLSLNLSYRQSKFIDTKLMKLAISNNLIDDIDYDSMLSKMLKLSVDENIPEKIKHKLETLLTSKL